METFFLLIVEGVLKRNKQVVRQILGVYTSFEEASNIMLEHISKILLCEGLPFQSGYVVSIEEAAIENGSWIPLRRRAEDKNRQEKHDKSVSQ